MNIEEYKQDKAKATAGVWRTFDGAEFLIASNSSPAYTRAMHAAARKHPPHKLRKDPTLAALVARETLADAVLLDWKGVFSGTTPVACTRANKLALLENTTFSDWVAGESQDIGNFQTEAMAEDAAELKSRGEVVDAVGGAPAVSTSES